MLWFLSIVSEIVLNCGIPVGRSLSPAWAPPLAIYAKVVTARPRMRPRDCRRRGVASITDARPGSLRAILHDFRGALGGTRTPTMLLTATSRQRVYQFRHERLMRSAPALRRTGSTARDVTNQGWRDKARRRGRLATGCPAISAAFA